MTDTNSPPLKHFVYERLRTMITSGFYSKRDVFGVIESEVEASPELEPEAMKFRGYAAKQWTAHEVEEYRWTARTENDELDTAFEVLNQHGIIALQNAGWTNSEGWADAWGKREEFLARGEEPRGTVFYHYQSLERGVAGEGLLLNFGIFHEKDDGDPEANARLAREICQVLREHGLAVGWNGHPNEKIHILPFPWRKRRVTPPPPRPTPWDCYCHPDGRQWEIRQCGSTLDLRITLTAEENQPPSPLLRHRKFPNSEEAKQAMQMAIKEQIAEGFLPASPPETQGAALWCSPGAITQASPWENDPLRPGARSSGDG